MSVINVGSTLAPNTGGVLNTIQGALIVSGDGRDIERGHEVRVMRFPRVPL